MKHPNHSYEIEARSHLPLQSAKLLSLGLQSTAYRTCTHEVYSSMLECIHKTYEALSLLNCDTIKFCLIKLTTTFLIRKPKMCDIQSWQPGL